MQIIEVKILINRACPYTQQGSRNIWYEAVLNGLTNVSSPTTSDIKEYRNGWNWGHANQHLVKHIVKHALG